jgi:hypothetical protein
MSYRNFERLLEIAEVENFTAKDFEFFQKQIIKKNSINKTNNNSVKIYGSKLKVS